MRFVFFKPFSSILCLTTCYQLHILLVQWGMISTDELWKLWNKTDVMCLKVLCNYSIAMSQSSSVIVTTRVQFPAGTIMGFFSSPLLPYRLWGPHSFLSMGTGCSSPGIKRPEPEADNSPPSNTEVNITWSYTSTPPIRFNGVVFS
jgi:hypothetical protein